MKKKFIRLFMLLIVCISFSFNISDIKADTKECKYKDNKYSENNYTVKIVDGKVTKVDMTMKNYDLYNNISSGTYNSCPNEIFVACTSQGDFSCSISFEKKTKYYWSVSLSNPNVNNNNNSSNDNDSNNIDNNNNNNSGQADVDTNPTTETVLETITCGSINLPKALPGLTRFIVMLIKIIVPLILIIMGMIDFMKATMGSDEKEISKAKDKFIKRLTAGVVVFLAITIVQFIVGIVAIDNEANIMNCVDCLISSEDSCN